MKQSPYLLILGVYFTLCASLLYGWNNQHWLGNSERVARWDGDQPADYLRLGVLKDGVYSVSADDIATALGITTNSALASLASGEFLLTCGTNAVAWSSDGGSLYFPGKRTYELYAPENVYFLRQGVGKVMGSRTAPPVSSGTNLWFMESSRFRSEFLDVSANFDRRSTNASLTNAPIFGMSLGDSSCNSTTCLFSAGLPGYQSSAATNLQLVVHAISFGDYAKVGDTHSFETFVNNLSCGTNSWSGEQLVRFPYTVDLAAVTNDLPQVKVTNLTPTQHFLLLDVEAEYPCSYQVRGEPLLCTGGDQSNIVVSGDGSPSSMRIWDVTDPLDAAVLDVVANACSNGWSAAFGCGDATRRYAVFEGESCFQPSVTGFKDINWNMAGEIPELVIVTPPRRWVSGFEQALEPLVALRRRQRLTLRVVDAEDIYNAFSYGLVSPHAFQRFVAAGLSSGAPKPLRHLLFAGYASTDYQLEVFTPDTVFKYGKKGYPALFPLLQIYQREYVNNRQNQLLLPNDMMLGDADGSGVPDVAVGRFLATDAVELSNMVAKTVAHDAPHSWNQAVIVSDWNKNIGDSGYYDFDSYCTGLAGKYVSGGWNTVHYHVEGQTRYNLVWKVDSEGTGVYYDLQDGIDMFYFIGHSGDDCMGNSIDKYNHIFNALPDPEGSILEGKSLVFSAWEYAPFAMAMGCRMGRYTSLDIIKTRTCLMEAAARNPSSAFCSSISAAGYLTFGDATELSDRFSNEVNLYGARTVGDAYLAVLDQVGAAGLVGIEHMVLLGDPSMPIRRVKYGSVFQVH